MIFARIMKYASICFALYCTLNLPGFVAFGHPENAGASFGSTASQDNMLPASVEGSTLLPIKITVKKKGMYKVTYADVQTAGWNPSTIDPTKLQLKSMGNNVPVLFVGEDDHSFDPGDYIIFYGEPVESDMTHSNATNKFTLTNIYWLYPFENNALRMKQQQCSNAQAQFLEDFKETVLAEQDLIMDGERIDSYYWANFPDYEDTEREDPASENISINVPGINPSKNATIRVRFKGRNNNQNINPDHHAKIVVNNEFSYDAYFDGWDNYIFESQIPASVFNDGENIITIKNMLDLGTGEDLFTLDWIAIAYDRYFSAQDDELFFTIIDQGMHTATIDGFHNNEIMLFDITDPMNVTQTTGCKTVQTGQEYSIECAINNDDEARYVALATDRIKTPDIIETSHETDLRETTYQIDYIMIAHEDFYDEIQKLAAYRESQGYRVKVVKTQDIYDEFNYGVVHSQAIKDFIDYAYHNWSPPAPSFVLLVGDGNSDATDRLGTGNKNFIPIKLDNLGGIGSGPNDSWYGAVDGVDRLSDVIIGRLPVKNTEQLKLIINRIIDYEQSPKAAWLRSALFVADDDRYFESTNEDLESNNLPFNYKTDFLNRSSGADSDAIIDKINSGTVLTVYSGHGNITSWNGLLYTSDLSKLKSSGKPTFLITLDCFNGHFSNPVNEGFSEEFLRNEGGSIGCLTPVGTGYPYEHQTIAQNFFSSIFEDNNTILGVAAYEAKLKAYREGMISDDTYEQYIYLGDPATRFQKCEFYLATPENRASISQGAQFSWVADGFSKFVLQFSLTPDFSTTRTRSVFTCFPQYAPGPFVWLLLKTMAQSNDMLWWRVGGIDRDITITDDWVIYFNRNVTFAEPRSFMIAE